MNLYHLVRPRNKKTLKERLPLLGFIGCLLCAEDLYCKMTPSFIPNPLFGLSLISLVSSLPSPRWLYWTDWGDAAVIGRVGMDGTNISAIITTKLEWPTALTIDYTTNKIFFADSHLNFLE